MFTLMLILTLVSAPQANEKKRDWIEGKVVNVEFKKDMSVPTTSGRDGGEINGLPTYKMYFTYIVIANGTRYNLEEQNIKPRYNTGDTVKFAIEKKNWIYLDDKGKEKRGDIKGTKKISN